MQPGITVLALLCIGVAGTYSDAGQGEKAAGAKFGGLLNPLDSQTRLPGALSEISGLALVGNSSVYAHGDEAATIFELDFQSGKILRTFSLGRPPAIGDFEAIAVRENEVMLITSAGVIHKAALVPRRRSLEFKTLDLRLGRECEIEGFAPAEAGNGFYAACKKSKGRLVIYKWSPEGGAEKAISLKLKGAVPNPGEFRVTEIVNDRKSGTLLVLDSAAGAILEVSKSGKSAGYWKLGGAHPQAEGMALLPDGRIIVADEASQGEGSIGSGRLTLYPPRR